MSLANFVQHFLLNITLQSIIGKRSHSVKNPYLSDVFLLLEQCSDGHSFIFSNFPVRSSATDNFIDTP